MKLTPRTDPGRANRRARSFSAEIARLRNEGYGYGAIQEALADAGVVVSISTVRREIVRLLKRPPPEVRIPMPAPVQTARTVLPIEPQATSQPDLDQRPRNGKAVAEAFMKTQITNPLFRAKERQ